jgi:hypothetical protein
LGAPGLVRFSPELEPDWSFPSHADHPWGAIDDCYALNVDGDTVWRRSGSPYERGRRRAARSVSRSAPRRTVAGP